MKHYYTLTPSPLGDLLITGNGDAITAVFMDGQDGLNKLDGNYQDNKSVFKNAIQQLKAYFAKELTSFDLPLQPKGTEFQQQVWQALTTIPYGQTWSYKKQALSISAPKAMRAVGAANGKNPIAIIIPCHRVVGSSGKLTGYAGGLDRKRWLLEHEGAQLPLLNA